ncbi:MAG: hypothetical protein ACRBN8_02270 [Nannocystales bacterium]
MPTPLPLACPGPVHDGDADLCGRLTTLAMDEQRAVQGYSQAGGGPGNLPLQNMPSGQVVSSTEQESRHSDPRELFTQLATASPSGGAGQSILAMSHAGVQ